MKTINRGHLFQNSLLAAGGLAILFGLLAWRFVWRSPPYYTGYGSIELPVRILTGEQYNRVVESHPRPYVVSVETNGPGALLLYGSEHTRDPHDPQIADLKGRWAAFGPDVALVESRLGFLVEGFMDPVEQFGEAGAVYAWARQGGLPAYTWEPNREQEVQLMLREFPAEQVALFYVLRPYFGDVRFGKPPDPDAVIARYIRERTRYPGLENAFHTASDIDRIWHRDFPGLSDWRDTSDRNGYPGYLGLIAGRSNQLRDEHLARIIVDLVQKGRRVFAVAGSSHAVKLEPALRAVLEAGE